MSSRLFTVLAYGAALFALAVMLLGSWTRLSNAGLSCPDWPGCYGSLSVPHSEQAVERANALWPERPVERAKAWKEMAHRYAAAILGLWVAVLALFALLMRSTHWEPDRPLTLLALALVVVQALLGMWTVTLLVQPAVVTAHLLLGAATATLLWKLALRRSDASILFLSAPSRRTRVFQAWAMAGVALVFVQIGLGGWTSANYAAFACTDFPGCSVSAWWPEEMDWNGAFVLFRELGVNHEGGRLLPEARAAIHMAHRVGALAILLYCGALALRALLSRERSIFRAGLFLFTTLLAQTALGVAIVLFGAPLAAAVVHGIGATLLLFALLSLIRALRNAPMRGVY